MSDNDWKKNFLKWENQHRFLTWYIACVMTLTLVLMIGELR